jgi:hypothetical protein
MVPVPATHGKGRQETTMHSNDRALLDSVDAYLSSGDSECSECGRSETCSDHPLDNDRGVCSACRDEILAEIELAAAAADCDAAQGAYELLSDCGDRDIDRAAFDQYTAAYVAYKAAQAKVSA